MSPLQQIFAFAASKQFLPIAILIIGYLVQLLSPMSKFPITIPFIKGRDPRPLIAALLGFSYGVLIAIQGGMTWTAAILHGCLVGGAVMGIFDLLVKFLFNGNPPVWLSAIFAFLTATPPPSEQPTNPRGLDSKGRVRSSLMLALLAASLILMPVAALLGGCQMFAKDVTDGIKTEACITAEVDRGSTSFEDIATACGGLAVQDVIDIVNTIIAAESKKSDAGVAASEPTPLHKALLAVHHK